MYIKIIGDNIIWPYTINNLREENPNVSFPNNPTPEDLEPFSVFIVHTKNKPVCDDERTEIIEEDIPKYVNDKWEQSWKIRKASKDEIEIYDLNNQPSPNWIEFKNKFLIDNSINNFFATKLINYPLINLSITINLILNDFNNFVKDWEKIKKITNIPQDISEKLINLANTYNLPDSFVVLFKSNR